MRKSTTMTARATIPDMQRTIVEFSKKKSRARTIMDDSPIRIAARMRAA